MTLSCLARGTDASATVCNETARTCTISDNYAASNSTSMADLYDSILRRSMFSSGWTLLFAVMSATANTSTLATYTLPPALVIFNDVVIASDSPGLQAHITIAHHTFVDPRAAGSCSFMRFNGNNIVVRDLAITVPEGCLSDEPLRTDPFFNGAALSFTGQNIRLQNITVTGALWAFGVDATTAVGRFTASNVSLHDAYVYTPFSVTPCWLGHIGSAGGIVVVTSTTPACVLTIDSRFSSVDTSGVTVPFAETVGVFPAPITDVPLYPPPASKTEDVFGPMQIALSTVIVIFVLAILVHGLRVQHHSGSSEILDNLPDVDDLHDYLGTPNGYSMKEQLKTLRHKTD
jgi:hypothetical protein